tara:strand:- start:68 stop:358 length:291 start_codon:yes stop_codon:yes gene_type:complete
MADEAEALEADRTQGRPEDPVSQKAAIIDAMEKENIPVPNNANKLTVGELEQKLEAGRFRKERMMEDKLVGDMYSGGYVKQYAAGGSVRKSKFMDD